MRALAWAGPDVLVSAAADTGETCELRCWHVPTGRQLDVEVLEGERPFSLATFLSGPGEALLAVGFSEQSVAVYRVVLPER